MANLDVKKGSKYTLKAMYSNGTIRFRLSSNWTIWNALAPLLSEAEWERLVTWVEHQRAEERVRQAVVE